MPASDQPSHKHDYQPAIMAVLLGTICVVAVIGCLKLGGEVYLLKEEVEASRHMTTFWKIRAFGHRTPTIHTDLDKQD
jgi:hypothetical protein